MSRRDVEHAVADALDTIPPALLAQLDNVVILVEDEPEPGLEDCLGVYEGVPLTERHLGNPFLPDRIIVFAGPTLRACSSLAELRREVAVTVVHEIAHYFGIDDDRLTELGWD